MKGRNGRKLYEQSQEPQYLHTCNSSSYHVSINATYDENGQRRYGIKTNVPIGTLLAGRTRLRIG